MGTHSSKNMFSTAKRLSGSTHPPKNTANRGPVLAGTSTHDPIGAVGGPYQGAGQSAKKSGTNLFAQQPGPVRMSQTGTVTKSKFGSKQSAGTNNR